MFTKRQLIPVLNALPVFEEAARLESFTRAGEQLGMSQPSVSRFIANLENHLQTRLFERRHNRLSLTANGKKLYQATATGLDEIRRACSDLRPAADTRVLTVECSHGFAHMWLLPRMHALLKRLPGWKLRTIGTESGSRLAADEADLIVRLGDGNWENEESLLLFAEEVFPVCSPEFAQKHRLLREDVTAADLPELPLVIQDFGANEWLGWTDWFAHFGIDYRYPQDAHPLYHYSLALQTAMEGKGIALAWAQLADPFLANNWLVEVPGLRLKTCNGYHLVFSPRCPVVEQVRRWAANKKQGTDHVYSGNDASRPVHPAAG